MAIVQLGSNEFERKEEGNLATSSQIIVASWELNNHNNNNKDTASADARLMTDGGDGNDENNKFETIHKKKGQENDTNDNHKDNEECGNDSSTSVGVLSLKVVLVPETPSKYNSHSPLSKTIKIANKQNNNNKQTNGSNNNDNDKIITENKYHGHINNHHPFTDHCRCHKKKRSHH